MVEALVEREDGLQVGRTGTDQDEHNWDAHPGHRHKQVHHPSPSLHVDCAAATGAAAIAANEKDTRAAGSTWYHCLPVPNAHSRLHRHRDDDATMTIHPLDHGDGHYPRRPNGARHTEQDCGEHARPHAAAHRRANDPP